MVTRLMFRITDFGDLAVALAVAALAFLWLCWHGRLRAAAWWLVAVAGCIASMGGIKLGFYLIGLDPADWALRNPSGHSAISMTVYGGIGWMIAFQLRDWRRPVLLALSLAAVAAIGYSRLYLHMHSSADVVAGLVVGAAWVAVFVACGYRRDAPKADPLPFMVMVALMALAAHGSHMPLGRVVALMQLPPGFAARL